MNKKKGRNKIGVEKKRHTDALIQLDLSQAT